MAILKRQLVAFLTIILIIRKADKRLQHLTINQTSITKAYFLAIHL